MAGIFGTLLNFVNPNVGSFYEQQKQSQTRSALDYSNPITTNNGSPLTGSTLMSNTNYVPKTSGTTKTSTTTTPSGESTGGTNTQQSNVQTQSQDNGSGESEEQRAIREYNDQMRGQIEGGYNDYFGQLDSMFGGLDTQANANTNIAQNSYNQSISDLNANRQSSLGDLNITQGKLDANQVKNLRDIAANVQNQYMAGNVMLGAKGAGDSSAANQYSYALNRVGSKARGDVMNQTAASQQEIENQKAKLNNIVIQETSRLDTELGNTKQSISSWLAEQQNAVKGMIAEGKLNKGKDLATLTQNLLNQALTAYQTKAKEIATKRTQLETWAQNNATTIGQLKSNLESVGQFAPNMPTMGTLNGSLTTDAQGNLRGIYGYGASKDETQTY